MRTTDDFSGETLRNRRIWKEVTHDQKDHRYQSGPTHSNTSCKSKGEIKAFYDKSGLKESIIPDLQRILAGIFKIGKMIKTSRGASAESPAELVVGSKEHFMSIKGTLH